MNVSTVLGSDNRYYTCIIVARGEVITKSLQHISEHVSSSRWHRAASEAHHNLLDLFLLRFMYTASHSCHFGESASRL